MNVLSLFDGISCGKIALSRAGIEVDKYFASEVNKYAIQISQKNNPDIIQIGDVKHVYYKEHGQLIWGEPQTDLQPRGYSDTQIDILIGGSPCTDFSFAGKQAGMSTNSKEEILSLERYLELKSQGFSFKGQSYLFWEYVRILKETKPKYFLLENVRMSKKWQDVISSVLRVEPVVINSNLVSAQNRHRLYWTNIPNIYQPEDKGILLKDVLEDDVGERYFVDSSKMNIKYPNDGKMNTITTGPNKSNLVKVEKSPYLSEKDIEKAKLKYGARVWPSGNRSGNMKFPDGADRKSKAVMSQQRTSDRTVHHIEDNYGIRRLTPLECERLQTVPDNYTEGVSNTQRYKMIGNGWTVDVISHIFSHIPK